MESPLRDHVTPGSQHNAEENGTDVYITVVVLSILLKTAQWQRRREEDVAHHKTGQNASANR